MENLNREVSENSEESSGEQCRVTMRLLDLMHRTHYELIQENGQRRLTAPELTAEYRERIKGAEVFLGRLPRDCYEDELMPVLEKIGRLLELRLMLDFSGSTRGYAFALFENTKTARRACQLLDGYQLRPGHRIGVVKSIDNCRLFFGGVPKDKTKADFAAELSKMLDGISEIYLYPNAEDRTQNRGFIFVEFKDHRSAAMARRKLIPGRVVLWDHEIAVDWADPEPGDPVDEEVMETVTALFVRNLPNELPHHKVRETIQKATGVPILKLKKINHFAFVHFETRELAEHVLNVMTAPNGVAEQNEWEIRWAKPIGSAKMMERQRSINEAIANNSQNNQSQQLLPKQNHNGKQYNGGIRRSAQKKKSKRQESVNNELDVGFVTPNLTNHSSENHEGLSLRPIMNSSNMNMNYQKILEDLVNQKLGAKCQFVCMQVYAPPGFICKITISRDEQILCEFQGDIHPTQLLAINLTSVDVYYRLSGNFIDRQMQSTSVYPSNPHVQARLGTCH
ncbi:hypothetical protein PV325_012304 [Microctonus aethiopoides]|uniref:RRM domain-containing protein n=1 Tax=Microctonus aethiopoides TaxID=144406 RepID=A0AA39KUB3_9HYME|nr:hypothetical protein PV325_012304 [Microctonus aethiopoides]KAK0174040.1 hypothetical protein PV328_007158 [Microctonus aethiopoides]